LQACGPAEAGPFPNHIDMASEANARVLSGFLDYLRIEKGLAALSISAYTTDIGQFAGFWKSGNARC